MEHTNRYAPFPFTAIVGLEDAKTALLAVSVNPLIGGVLLRGDKGTGKTTLVRSLANLLPSIKVVSDCPFNCDPDNPMLMCDNCYRRWVRGEDLPVTHRRMKVVDLPLSVTPDRLIGTIDVEKFLKEGVRAVSPGLLAEANRNILYIDEVNLLDDYIADLILDAAAYGWNIIEREHVSFRHPSRFILIGSMNPEEGELRPQLLDRFGLIVNVEAPTDPEARAEIVKRVEEFSSDPASFYRKFEPKEGELRQKVLKAREILPRVRIGDDLLRLVTKTLTELRIRTCRADIVIVRTAKALAALDGRLQVSMDDIKKSMKLALPHRLRLTPFQKPESRKLDEALSALTSSKGSKGKEGRTRPKEGEVSEDREGGRQGSGGGSGSPRRTGEGLERLYEPTQHIPNNIDKLLDKVRDRSTSTATGGCRRIYKTVIGGYKGVRITYVWPPKGDSDLDLIGTLITSRLYGGEAPVAQKVRRAPQSTLAIIALDSSGSMNFRKRISVAKAVASRIVREGYVNRLWVSLISFRGDGISEYIPPSKNYQSIMDTISKIRSGKRTPLSLALKRVIDTARAFSLKHRFSEVIVYLITDGKANVGLAGTDIASELKALLREFKRLGLKTVIIDPRGNSLDPGISYLDLISQITGAPILRV